MFATRGFDEEKGSLDNLFSLELLCKTSYATFAYEAVPASIYILFI